MEFISSRYFFDRKSHCHIGNQLWLSSKYLLFLDQSEKSPDSLNFGVTDNKAASYDG